MRQCAAQDDATHSLQLMVQHTRTQTDTCAGAEATPAAAGADSDHSIQKKGGSFCSV